MARRYKELWDTLKIKKKVTIRCRPEKMPTIIQALMKEKSMENAPRKALDLPSFGRLEYKANKEDGTVTFKLVSEVLAETL